jgi:hypothetical protein
MKRNDKFYYCTSASLKYIHFYVSWVEQAQLSGLDISLIIRISSIKAHRLVKERTKHYPVPIILIPNMPIFSDMLMYLFFFVQCILHSSITVHFKKINLKLDKIKILRKLCPCFYYIIDKEGNISAELDYLTNNPYKAKFYNDTIFHMKTALCHEPAEMANANLILVNSKYAQQVLIEQYALSEDRVYILPTGANSDMIYFDTKLRKQVRKDLGLADDRFVIVYGGGVFYSWQNLSKTIAMFKLLHSHRKNIFLIMIIYDNDHSIAQEILQKYQLDPDCYMLTSVPHERLNGYLNAADAGVLLRDAHPMNYFACPGKVGEYALAGLPLIITEAACIYHNEVSLNGFGVALNDVNDYHTINERIHLFIDNKPDRYEIAKWGVSRFAVKSYRESYRQILLAARGVNL